MRKHIKNQIETKNFFDKNVHFDVRIFMVKKKEWNFKKKNDFNLKKKKYDIVFNSYTDVKTYEKSKKKIFWKKCPFWGRIYLIKEWVKIIWKIELKFLKKILRIKSYVIKK